MVRCFLAVYPIKESITNKLVEIQKDIRNFIIGKEVEKENFHITISFFGEVENSKILDLKEKIEKVVSRIPKRNVTLNGVKLIPDKNFVRVIAIEVFGLEDISKEIEKNVGGDVKPAHLTLFRVKNVKDRVKLIEFCSKSKISENFEVNDLKLMKSTLTRSGPIYEPIYTFSLL